jgi:hypothetical protein
MRRKKLKFAVPQNQPAPLTDAQIRDRLATIWDSDGEFTPAQLRAERDVIAAWRRSRGKKVRQVGLPGEYD